MKKRYNTLNDYYREIFGEKIFKVPIDAGFDCPNRDGTVAHGGCTFCTVSGSGDAIVAPDAPIRDQFYKEIDFMHRKWPEVKKYLVYFQKPLTSLVLSGLISGHVPTVCQMKPLPTLLSCLSVCM